MSSSETSQVCSLPLPPVHYINNYTDENIRRGRAPRPPPPIQDTYTMFGNTFNADDTIIRPLEAQGIKRLYPQHFDRRRELRKLNQSLLVNFLDLIDLLVWCPESPRRTEKVEDLSLLFIHIHHLLNEFRPHQARETLRVMMEIQKRNRIEISQRFQKHLDKIVKSNATHLILKNVALSVSGRYGCEISADSPSFSTSFVGSDMNIVILPKGFPELHGIKPRYKVGDKLKATCVLRHSRPAANLTWALNGITADSSYLRHVNVSKNVKSQLENSYSTLSFVVKREHFNENGRLKIRCTGSIFNAYWRVMESSAEEEKSKATVIPAQDYRLNEKLLNTIPVDTTSQTGGTSFHRSNILLYLLLYLIMGLPSCLI